MKNFINGKRIKLEATIKKGINKNKYPSLNKKLYNLFSKFIKKKCAFNFFNKYSARNNTSKLKTIKNCLKIINNV